MATMVLAKNQKEKEEEEGLPRPRPRLPFGPDETRLDLATQLVYMSAVATAGLSRDKLFEQTGKLPYLTSKLFRTIRLLAARLNYNYAAACRNIAERTKDTHLQGFLLRFSSSLSSGEPEDRFLARESGIELENYAGGYERDVESMKKWTDAFVTLLVSVVLIVIITVVSTLLYTMGPAFIMTLTTTSFMATFIGAWLIYRTAPAERKTHGLRRRSPQQVRTRRLGMMLVPAGIIAASLIGLATQNLGVAMVIISGTFFPVGWAASKYDQAIDRFDQEAAVFLRALGGVAAAIGTTISEAMGRLDLRSMGSLEPGVRRLKDGLLSGLAPDLCWERFVADTGSEMVMRGVGVFWDAIKVGGDPAPIGLFASRFLDKMNELRAKRAMVAATFRWLILPMHTALVALMLFIIEVVSLFSEQMSKAQKDVLTGKDAAVILQQTGGLAFGTADLHFIYVIVLAMVVVLTLVNSFVSNSALCGDRYTFCLHLGLMAAISGVCLLIIPLAADHIFGGIINSVAQAGGKR